MAVTVNSRMTTLNASKSVVIVPYESDYDSYLTNQKATDSILFRQTNQLRFQNMQWK